MSLSRRRNDLRLALTLGLLAAIAALSGCVGPRAFIGEQPFSPTQPNVPQATAFMPLPISVSLQDVIFIARHVTNYTADRCFDFLDIFEVGLGFGLGLGAEASALVGSVGLEHGRYTWFGVFGNSQIGKALDDAHTVVGLPFSPFVALFGGGPDFGGLLGFIFRCLGYENGIGGSASSFSAIGGFRAVGPLAYDGFYPSRATSASGAVGASVSLGPIAAVARVRAGAIINFITGFVGWHPFAQPYRSVVVSP